MEFIDFAKNEMESVVQRLYEIDPFWKRCSPCVQNGKCCKGANPCFSQKEQARVLEENNLSTQDFKKLKWNLRLGMKCPFHTRNRCIIHENRSLNCMWTPYYVTVDSDDIVHYYVIDDRCRFRKVTVKKKDIEFRIDEQHFVWLPHGKTMRCHIYLNSLSFINRGYIWDIPATEVAKKILKSK